MPTHSSHDSHEWLVLAPASGQFQAVPGGVATNALGAALERGDRVAAIVGPDAFDLVVAPCAGAFGGMLASPGQEVFRGQAVAWLSTT